ncbi:Methionine--tRNA ligase, partial [Dissostichus eleginoides]
SPAILSPSVPAWPLHQWVVLWGMAEAQGCCTYTHSHHKQSDCVTPLEDTVKIDDFGKVVKHAVT